MFALFFPTSARMSASPYDLARFVAAQEDVYAAALAELRQGQKRTHWMWFVLPQLRGLGHSAMATRYGIGSRGEAASYLAHPVLGPRLVACVEALLAHEGRSAREMLGDTDAMKLRSCVTLFAEVAGPESVFADALARFFAGEPDSATLRLLARSDG